MPSCGARYICNVLVIFAALALGILLAGAVFFFVGRSAGRRAERAAQIAASSTAEETAKPHLDDAAARRRDAPKGGDRGRQGRDDPAARELGSSRRRSAARRSSAASGASRSATPTLDRKLDILDAARQGQSRTRRATSAAARSRSSDREAGAREADAPRSGAASSSSPACPRRTAKAELIARLAEEAQAEAANQLREIRETAKRNADREAKKIVALAVQRIASEHTAEITVSRCRCPTTR